MRTASRAANPRLSAVGGLLAVVLAALPLAGCKDPLSAPVDGNSPATEAGTSTGDVSGVTEGVAAGGGVVADHMTAGALETIPIAYLEQARSSFHILYGHTSHGSQIITGLQMLQSAGSLYAFNTADGKLHFDEIGDDLGENGDLTWVAPTRAALNQAGSGVNVVMWSWCGGVSGNSAAGIDAYLRAMSALERDYPAVTFIYMTGHLDGSGADGNLYARNNQIRDYCRANAKVLFDFADIESYDPAGRYYPDGSDACEWCTTWCQTHACPGCGGCAHSHCFNCYQKGRAFWWLLARLAGWSPS